MDCRHVFVYGTLRSGFTNLGRDVLTTHGRLLAEGTVRGRLHDLGQFPAMLATEDDQRARGEVYELVQEPKVALERLDRYEGAGGERPLPYERRQVEVELDDGETLTAWTYVWTEDPPEGSWIEGGDWVEYVRERS